MIYSSLAVLAMSASAAINPFSNLVHLHPRHAQPDTRISVVIRNESVGFRDVKIGGHIYTIQASRSISIKAPTGTIVYAASPAVGYHSGDAILEVNPKLENKTINLN